MSDLSDYSDSTTPAVPATSVFLASELPPTLTKYGFQAATPDEQFGEGLRVMHVISAFQLGGAERVVLNLVLQHAKMGLKPCVLAIREPRMVGDPVGQHFRDALCENRVPFFDLGSSNLRRDLVFLPFRFWRKVLSFSPHLVHSHTDVPDLIVSMTRRFHAFPAVRTIHSTSLWATHKLTGRIAEKGFHNDLVIGVSDAALEAYRALRAGYDLQQSSTQHVIVNGVKIWSLAQISDTKGQRRGSALRAAFFGRADVAKGLDVLVSALKLLDRESSPSLEISIFSDAANDPGFRERLGTFSFPVSLSPPVYHAAEIMAQFDIVIVPSRVEGLGLVALEALAAHTPVIASCIPGLSEVLPPNWPLKVPANDPVALKNMLSDVANGSYDLARLGRLGYESTQGRSIEAFSRQYLDAYLGYLKQPV